MTAILAIRLIQLIILVESTHTHPVLAHRGHQLIVSALESLGPAWLLIVIVESGEQRGRDVALGGRQLVVRVHCWGLRGCKSHID